MIGLFGNQSIDFDLLFVWLAMTSLAGLHLTIDRLLLLSFDLAWFLCSCLFWVHSWC